jgi:uncharacterized repeat protein (TIGR01451 family)
MVLAKILREIIAILLLSFFSVSTLFGADSCIGATTLSLNDISDDQEIDQPFVVGHSGGEALYFKINIQTAGKLYINTLYPTVSDTVDTYGRLLKSDCSNLNATDTKINDNPRYFKFEEDLEPGTYYLRVHNETEIDDSVSDLETGFFRIETKFTNALVDKKISITKNSYSAINSGEEIIYTITVLNEGSEPTKTVKVIDPIPVTDDGSERLEFVGTVETDDWSCSVVGDNVECTLNSGVIDPSDYQRLFIKYKAGYKEYDRYVRNTTSVDVTYDNGSLSEDSDERSVRIRSAIAGIRIEKIAQDTGHTNINSIVQGEEFYYHIYVENNGTRIVDQNVVVQDSIKGDFEFIGFENDSAWNCDYSSAEESITCSLKNDLYQDDIYSFDIRAKAVGDPDDPESISYSAVVNADTVVGSVFDSDDANLNIVKKEPKVNIKKVRSQENVVKGHSAYYTITVDSIGSNISLSNIKVTDNVPSELVLTGASGSGWSCSISGNTAVCTLDFLDKGATADSIRIDVKGKDIKNDVINSVTVTTDEGATDDASESINVVAPTPSISIEKHAPSSVYSLSTFNYGFYVENNGTEPITGVTVTDTFDSRLVLPSDWNSRVPSSWSCAKSGQKITCDYTQTLEPENHAYFEIKVQAPYLNEDSDINNTAVVDGTSQGENVHDESTVTTEVSDISIGIALNKVTDKPTVYSGNSYKYTLTAANDSDVELNDIVIADTIPELLDGNFTINQGEFDCSETVGRELKCKLDSLARRGENGYRKSFTIDITAPIVSSSTVITNRATTTSVIRVPNHDDIRVDSNSSVDVTILPPASDLLFTKSSSKDKIIEKDIFDYILSVENRAIVDEYNLTITDEINSTFTIESIEQGDWSCIQNSLNVTCSMDKIAAKDTSSVKIKVKAPDTIEDDITIPNHAHLTTARDNKDAYDDVNLLSSNSALSIFMRSDNPVYTTNLYKYTIEISNSSGIDIDRVDLNETLPTSIEFDHFESDGWNCSYDSATRVIRCDNNGIKLADEDKIIELYVTAPDHEMNVTNSITMSSSLDTHQRNATTVTYVKNKVAKLIYSKATTDKSIIKEGDSFTYLLNIRNDGKEPESDVNATNVKVVLNLDENITYESHSAPDWNCSISSHTLTCILPYLETGKESPDINVTVNAPVHKQVISRAHLTADQLPKAEEKVISMSVDVREVVSLDMSLELLDGLDVVEADSVYYYNFIVKNHDETKIAQDVIVDINTTSLDDFSLESYEDSDDWDCLKSGKLLRCQLKDDLLANSEKILKLEVTAPDKTTKVEISATLYSEYVNDTNINNNTIYEDTNIVATDYDKSSPRDFMKVPLQGKVDLNIFGDLLTIGNQSICEKSDSFGGMFPPISVSVCKEPTTVYNDGTYQNYVNLESGEYKTLYKNATNAKLDIDDSDEIVWAGLYWMGRLDKERDSDYDDKIKEADKVYLRADSNSSGYIEVKAQRAAKAINNSGESIIVDKFNFIIGDRYFDYQGMADVTSYVKANRGGVYWVADVQASEGKNVSAGWNLVVIVQDMKENPTKDLKNITIFDGFQGVWKNSINPDANNYPDNINQTVKGFLTPQVGEVKSSLIFFGFEGDEEISDFIKVGDSSGVLHDLTNSLNPTNDVVNSTVSRNGNYVTTRSPNLKNTSGIDVDEFDLGDSGLKIIQNAQTDANISIGSGGDRFFLGMFGFSTNLYDPVCYMQTFYDVDFKEKLKDNTELRLGDRIGIEVEFHNKEIQTLENISAYAQIDKNFAIGSEEKSSFKLINVGESKPGGHNEFFEFSNIQKGDDNITEAKTPIGTGASKGVGGELGSDESVYIRYNAVIDELNDDNLTHNIYLASYEPNPDKKVQVPRCKGEDQKLRFIQNTTQGFEVTHEHGIRDDYVDGTIEGDITKINNEQHLFTQVQDKNFTVDIVALDDHIENRVTEYKGVVRVELTDMTNFDGTLDGCNLLSTIGTQKYETFNDIDIKSVSYSYSNAHKEVGFRVRYLVDKYKRHIWVNGRYTDKLDINGIKDVVSKNLYGDNRCNSECTVSDEACYSCVYKHVKNGGFALFSCSSDRFAIKPKSVSLDINSTTLVGGRDYTLYFDANATGYDDHNVSSSNGELEYNLTNHSSCHDLNGSLLTGSQKIEFKNGEANLTDFKYDNIGQIDLIYIDSSWTRGDQNLTDPNMSDCIIGSSSNTHDSNGKVGCNVSGGGLFTFSPARFINKLISFSDFSNNFTYLSNERNVTAPMKFTIEAVLDDNSTATNFTTSCYASDVNYTINLNGVSDPLYFDLNNSVMDNNSSTGEFTTTEGNFTDGVATIEVGLNARRELNQPVNPFIVNSKDINISVDDNGTYDIHGVDFSTSVDTNATFYYGRLHVPDIETTLEDIDTTFYYEVYCKGCNRSIFTLTNGSESVDSINWVIANGSHTSPAQGSYSSLESKNGMTFASTTFRGTRILLGATNSAPHSDKITFRPSPWLLFNKFQNSTQRDSFNINVVSTSTNWSGKGEMGTRVDSNLSQRSTKKLEW